MPTLMVYTEVLNEGVSRERELAYLQKLPDQGHLTLVDLGENLLRMRFNDHTV
jgi:hypothetical protein